MVGNKSSAGVKILVKGFCEANYHQDSCQALLCILHVVEFGGPTHCKIDTRANVSRGVASVVAGAARGGGRLGPPQHFAKKKKKKRKEKAETNIPDRYIRLREKGEERETIKKSAKKSICDFVFNNSA